MSTKLQVNKADVSALVICPIPQQGFNLSLRYPYYNGRNYTAPVSTKYMHCTLLNSSYRKLQIIGSILRCINKN